MLFLEGEEGQCLMSTQPKILFCDLELAPGESKNCKCGFLAQLCFEHISLVSIELLKI